MIEYVEQHAHHYLGSWTGERLQIIEKYEYSVTLIYFNSGMAVWSA